MFILHDLWKGSIVPSEKVSHSGDLYHAIQKETIQKEQSLRKQLSEDAIESLEHYQNKYGELISLEQEDAFIQGFRMGAKIILDVIREESQ